MPLARRLPRRGFTNIFKEKFQIVNVGDLKDVRDKSKAPSFQNFYKKSSEELRDDLLKAIENQKAALIKAEGEGTSTEKELRALEKWATKLNCSKADKDAAKVLKAARLT